MYSAAEQELLQAGLAACGATTGKLLPAAAGSAAATVSAEIEGSSTAAAEVGSEGIRAELDELNEVQLRQFAKAFGAEDTEQFDRAGLVDSLAKMQTR